MVGFCRPVGYALLLAFLGACTSFPWGSSRPPDDAESRRWTQERMAKEIEVVVSVPGARVCRQFSVGIGNREWVRGIVVEAASGRIRIRIDDPGQYLHALDGVELHRGSIVQDAMDAWIPCT